MKNLCILALVTAVSGCGSIGNQTKSTPPATVATKSSNMTSVRTVGLTQPPSLSVEGNTATEIMPTSVDTDEKSLSQRLQTCLFEAKQLSRMSHGAYKAQVAALYRNIQATQYYASIAKDLATSTTDTITPLYQYKVNDACNTISQSLLTELKKGASQPGRGN